MTDDAGASDSATVTITVEEDDGQCGDERTTASAESSLWSWWDADAYTYTAELASPCQVTFSIEGPSNADFDLYVTLDGREPTPRDFDKRSISPNSEEMVVIEDVAAGQEFGILVDSYSGRGSYTVAAEELGT